MKTLIRPAISLFILLNLITGVFYPAIVTIIAQLTFPAIANGSLIFKNGQPIGSALIGQQFTQTQYFWSRPSATTPPYNAAASTGSNLGPLNPALITAIQQRAIVFHNADPTNTQPIPLELLTTSASGLDPHISPASAYYQAERVARARNVNVNIIKQLINQHTEPPDWGFLGNSRINVLRLNLALDAL